MSVQVMERMCTLRPQFCDAIDGGGKSACKMWLEEVLILLNSSSSAELQRSSNV